VRTPPRPPFLLPMSQAAQYRQVPLALLPSRRTLFLLREDVQEPNRAYQEHQRNNRQRQLVRQQAIKFPSWPDKGRTRPVNKLSECSNDESDAQPTVQFPVRKQSHHGQPRRDQTIKP